MDAPNPTQLSQKLALITTRCETFNTGSSSVTQSQLDSTLTAAMQLFKSTHTSVDENAKHMVIQFLKYLVASFSLSFWPPSYCENQISSFFVEFFEYMAKAIELSSEFGIEVAPFMDDLMVNAVDTTSDGLIIFKAFLMALCTSFLPLLPTEGDRLVGILLDSYLMHSFVNRQLFVANDEKDLVISEAYMSKSLISESPKEEKMPSNSVSTHMAVYSQGRSADVFQKINETSVPVFEIGCASTSSSSPIIMSMGISTSLLVGDGERAKQHVNAFEDAAALSLEKLEIAFDFISQVLGILSLQPFLLDRVMFIGKRQLQSVPSFFNITSRNWGKQGLEAFYTKQLNVYGAATLMHVKSLTLLESASESLKTLALLKDAAEACLNSAWLNLKSCEELFASFLNGVALITFNLERQLPHSLLIYLKPLVMSSCAIPDGEASSLQGAMLETLLRTCCQIIEFGWSNHKASILSFISDLTAFVHEQNEYDEQDVKQPARLVQLNVTSFLADLAVRINRAEVVDTVFPHFIRSLEDSEASSPGSLQNQVLLDAVSRIACLGFEKSYHEAVVLLIRSYLSKLNGNGTTERNTVSSDADTGGIETLAARFLQIATGLTSQNLRADYQHRLLSLFSNVGRDAELKNGSGAEFLGLLLPAVAEISTDSDPTRYIKPALRKLFRNLWFYIALYGLAPPIVESHNTKKLSRNSQNYVQSPSTAALKEVDEPYMWETRWSSSVERIAQGSPALVVNSVKWLEDEMDLSSMHYVCSRRGSNSKKAAANHRVALSVVLGGRVKVSEISKIGVVKATFLRAVAVLEIMRFRSNGGVLKHATCAGAVMSAFCCIFEYLKAPNLEAVVFQCLTAIVHQALGVAVCRLENQNTSTAAALKDSEEALSAHACFLIKSLSESDEHLRGLSATLLAQLRDTFPQLLWDSSCLDSLIFPVHNRRPYNPVTESGTVAAVNSLYQICFREWIICALSYAPCSTLGLLQEKLKENFRKSVQCASYVVPVLSKIRLQTGLSDYWTETSATNMPAVLAAAAAASGANLKNCETFKFEVLSMSIMSVTSKISHAGEIAGIQISSFVSVLQQFVGSGRGTVIDKLSFRETCCKATAVLLSHIDADADAYSTVEGFSQLLRLLCWCPTNILTHEAVEIGVYVWTWLISAAPQLGPYILAELVDAWIWTIDSRRGLFSADVRYFGPVARLSSYLGPGEPNDFSKTDAVEQISAHRLWIGFFIDRFNVIKHSSVSQLLLLGKMLEEATRYPLSFCHHPAATGTFFTLMLLGLKFCRCRLLKNLQGFTNWLPHVEDRIYRASLEWFAHEPEWCDLNNQCFAESEAQSVSVFVHHLLCEGKDVISSESERGSHVNGSSTRDMVRSHMLAALCFRMLDHKHHVLDQMDNYASGREKRRKLLIMLSQHMENRLYVWAHSANIKDISSSLPKISSDKWTEYAKTAFDADPRVSISLPYRFPANRSLRGILTHLVQDHLPDLYSIPEALRYFATPEAVKYDSPLLQHLRDWAACSITHALHFLTPAYNGNPHVIAYALRVLESYPAERLTFLILQLVQSLRYDDKKLVEGYLLRAAQRNDLFAHYLIWHLQGEASDEKSNLGLKAKRIAFEDRLRVVRQKIIDGFSPRSLELFKREFDFFDKITSISGLLLPIPKDERQAALHRELEKIQVTGEDLYLPTDPSKLVKGIQVEKGVPLQSAAKVPIKVTFDVVERYGDGTKMQQSCIFKVGDDCRQDALALQVIALLRDIFDAVGLNLYLYPYRVLPTGPGSGIIEVVPNSCSRSQMGETTDGGLYEIFQQKCHEVGSPSFEVLRENFIMSSAGYAVASFLLQPKDRHNGNLLIDKEGRLVHIDFGFILETSPGGNMHFERAHFKLTHEMTQLLDPSGKMKSETWDRFVGLCVKGYLAARQHMDDIITIVQLMQDSGLPCFSRGDPIGNLRKRFHPEMSEREAAHFMTKVCADAYNNWTTHAYDVIQHIQQGIEM